MADFAYLQANRTFIVVQIIAWMPEPQESACTTADDGRSVLRMVVAVVTLVLVINPTLAPNRRHKIHTNKLTWEMGKCRCSVIYRRKKGRSKAKRRSLPIILCCFVCIILFILFYLWSISLFFIDYANFNSGFSYGDPVRLFLPLISLVLPSCS
mgnify:CR=1 FL=1